MTSGMTVNILDASYEWNCQRERGRRNYTGYMRLADQQEHDDRDRFHAKRRQGQCAARPSSSYGSIGSLKSGTRVTVLLKNGWCQITGGGLTGFMATRYLSNMGTTNAARTAIPARSARGRREQPEEYAGTVSARIAVAEREGARPVITARR
ncbi:MAG: SH3 domain-containing protein [Christensenellales bacterium]